MKITAESWEEYIRSLSRLNEEAGQKMAEYIARHGAGDPDTLIVYAQALAQKYGEGSAELACQMYDAMARASGVQLPPAEPAAPADISETARMVNGTRQSPPLLQGGVSRLVKQTAADTTLKNAIRDGAEFAWIPHGDSCAFCMVLASRGWQRASKAALKNGHAEHIHANCDCEYAVRFDGRSTVAGYDPEQYLARYEAAGGDINELRRGLYAKNRDRINAQKRAAWAARKLRDGNKGSILDTPKQNAGKPDVNFVCRLDLERYKVVSNNIQTDEVIITDQQLKHIQERHPDISKSVMENLSNIIQNPDYIIETDRPNTANILKRLEVNGKKYQLILRLKTDSDPANFKNSIITMMTVNEKRYQQYLRNRNILYKGE